MTGGAGSARCIEFQYECYYAQLSLISISFELNARMTLFSTSLHTVTEKEVSSSLLSGVYREVSVTYILVEVRPCATIYFAAGWIHDGLKLLKQIYHKIRYAAQVRN